MKRCKEWIAIGLALAIFLGLCFFAASLLMPLRTDHGLDWKSYKKEEHTDVLFVGSSIVYCDVVPAVVFDESGISSYVVAGPEQTIPISYYYIREACRTQTPQTVVLELTGMFFEKYQGFTLSNVGAMPYSFNRLAATFNAAEPERRMGLLFPILDYHDRWYSIPKAELREKFSHNTDSLAGYTLLRDAVPQDAFSERSCADDGAYAYALEYLKKISDFCSENSIKLILYLAPGYVRIPEERLERLQNDLSEIEFAAFYDFNAPELWEQIAADGQTDWHDGMHYNALGAEKFSRVFGRLLLSDGISPAGDAVLWTERIEYFEHEKTAAD